MSKVIYNGTSDVQIFDKADFAKGGVDDQGKVTFRKGEEVEVSDAAAEALLSKEGLFGDYGFEAPKEEDEGTDEKPEGDVDENLVGTSDTSGADVTTEGTAVPGAAGNVGRGSTGRGTSTR